MAPSGLQEEPLEGAKSQYIISMQKCLDSIYGETINIIKFSKFGTILKKMINLPLIKFQTLRLDKHTLKDLYKYNTTNETMSKFR